MDAINVRPRTHFEVIKQRVMSETETPESAEQFDYQYLQDFLKEAPPGTTASVRCVYYTPDQRVMLAPLLSGQSFPTRPCLMPCEIELHCDHEKCNGVRCYQPRDPEPTVFDFGRDDVTIELVRSNC